MRAVGRSRRRLVKRLSIYICVIACDAMNRKGSSAGAASGGAAADATMQASPPEQQ